MVTEAVAEDVNAGIHSTLRQETTYWRAVRQIVIASAVERQSQGKGERDRKHQETSEAGVYKGVKVSELDWVGSANADGHPRMTVGVNVSYLR